MKQKMSLLYVSPMPPMKSGISEYSTLLVSGLKKYFDITILVDGYTVSKSVDMKSIHIENYRKEKDYSVYDVIIYNFGNNPDFHLYMFEMIEKYSGYIILHDYSLFYLSVMYYLKKNILMSKIYEFEGIDGIQLLKENLIENKTTDILLCKNLSSVMPLNKEVLSRSKGIFVHSEYAKNQIDKLGLGLTVIKINMIQPVEKREISSKSLREKYDIRKTDIIIGSFGFIAETKQNELVCKVVDKYNSLHSNKIHYVMVGEGDVVNKYLNKFIHKTGFIDNHTVFLDYMLDCDIVMNLRWPYNGESSATLHQCMSFSKTCFVTNIGSFTEIPDDAVIKVDYNISVDELYDKLCDTLNSKLTVGNVALKYIKTECSVESISKEIFNKIEKLKNY